MALTSKLIFTTEFESTWETKQLFANDDNYYVWFVACALGKEEVLCSSSFWWFSYHFTVKEIFISYLHCTLRFPADDIRLPTLLIITHLYCPESDRWTSVIVKLWLLFSDHVVSRRFAVIFRFSSFFVQVNLGEGFPSTMQLNTTSSPSTMVASSGFSTISGATWNLKKQKR